jgi:methylated-DNA-[protein]-cysteine S-methyltransferase
MKSGFGTYNSPIGLIHVVADEKGIKKIELFEEDWLCYIKENKELKEDVEICRDAIKQLDEYFKGTRKVFDIPLSIDGTEFRKKVWKTLLDIPYGETRSYQYVAEAIGNPKAVRAIGQANRANPVPIIIPCHRVIGKNGDLVGYAGGRTNIKLKLLEIEGFKIKK